MEKVFAVPAEIVDGLMPEGFAPGDEAKLLSILATHGSFHDRTVEFENNQGFRQILPYVVARHSGKILTYQRLSKSERRLDSKFSIGFGGHINPLDADDGQNPILAALQRELNEEVSFAGAPVFRFIGTIKVQRTPVDTVHIALVYFADLDSDGFRINEPEGFASTSWKTPAELVELRPQMESWSQILVENLFAKAPTLN